MGASLAACVVEDPYPGYRDYDYYYYPDVNVYFGLGSGHYFYVANNVWVRRRYLPPHIHLHPRYRRPVLIRDPRPYRFNKEHRHRFRGAHPPSRKHRLPPRAGSRRRWDENRVERERIERESTWRRRRRG